MSEKIEPALSAEEWAGQPIAHLGFIGEEEELAGPFVLDSDGSGVAVHEGDLYLAYDRFHSTTFSRPDAVIAVANAALLDSDRRKITREKIATLRSGLDCVPQAEGDQHAAYQAADAFLDALESYLSPINRE